MAWNNRYSTMDNDNFDPLDYATLEDSNDIHTRYIDRTIKYWKLHKPIKVVGTQYPITHISTWITKTADTDDVPPAFEKNEVSSLGQLDRDYGNKDKMTFEELNDWHQRTNELNERIWNGTRKIHDSGAIIDSPKLHKDALRRTLRILYS